MKDKEILYIKQNDNCYIDKDCKWGNKTEAKEKQIVDTSWKAKMVEKGLYKDAEEISKSTDKEKQIKEMAKDLRDTHSHIYALEETLAEKLISKGWIKTNKNNIVLTRKDWKEYEKFKSFMERNEWESIEHMETTLDKCQKILYERLQQASKETAEKFTKECKKYKVKKFNPVGIDQRDTGVSWIEMPEWKLDEFAKQFKVEIKE